MAKPIRIDPDVYQSRLLWSGPKSAIRIYFELLRRRKWKKTPVGGRKVWAITNNGQIELPYADLEKRLKYTRPTITKGIDWLVDHGFMDITHQGSGGVKGDKSQYAVSERWRDWGADKFVKKTRDKNCKKGIGFDLMWQKKRQKKRQKKTNIGKAEVTHISKADVTPKGLGTRREVKNTLPEEKEEKDLAPWN